MRIQQISGESIRQVIETAMLAEFDTKQAIRWTKINGEWIYKFKVGDGDFQLHMMPAQARSPADGGRVDGVDVVFSRMRPSKDGEWPYETGNTGDTGSQARVVFSHVISGIIDFCKRHDPAFIEFRASTVLGKSSLYQKIYGYLARQGNTFGFAAPKVEDSDYDDEDAFILWHQNELRENATAGATSAASIASVPGGRGGQVGGLGVGFNPNGDQGIYQGKPKKKAKSGNGVIRR